MAPAPPDCPPRALVLHGSASTAEFAVRALGPALREAGYEPTGLDVRSGDVAVVEAALDRAADASVRLVAGVSLGAHAAVRWAARRRGPVDGLWLVLPAWTGTPGPVAALSAAAADEVEAEGLDRLLARLGPQGWVGAELSRAWPTYGQAALVEVLRQTAGSPGPDESDLAALGLPCAVVGRAGDPFHPASTAELWAGLIPRAAVRVLASGGAPQDLGTAALAAWRGALSGSR